MSAPRAVVTGLGFVTSIGNGRAEVLRSLRETRSGIERFEPFAAPDVPVKLAGTVKGFSFPDEDQEDWAFPGREMLSRTELRTLTPNSAYSLVAMSEAIADAGLPSGLVSHPQTGLFCASAGSPWLVHTAVSKMLIRGVQRMPPQAAVFSIPSSLHVNLVARFKIKGASLGFSSACASSAHAIGSAVDEIRLGRQRIVFAVGAEDCTFINIMTFAALRALNLESDPARVAGPFDALRSGFVGTGGSAVLVIEELEHARARGASIYAEIAGWGQASDGFDVVLPDPSGDGLARAVHLAANDAAIDLGTVDYINAHATGTTAGDASEINAMRQVFGAGKVPRISSTKGLTGHGLSLAGAMEAGFCCLAIKERFTPVSAGIIRIDPAFEGVPIVTQGVDAAPRVVINNSSGFGGANVAIFLRELD